MTKVIEEAQCLSSRLPGIFIYIYIIYRYTLIIIIEKNIPNINLNKLCVLYIQVMIIITMEDNSPLSYINRYAN